MTPGCNVMYNVISLLAVKHLNPDTQIDFSWFCSIGSMSLDTETARSILRAHPRCSWFDPLRRLNAVRHQLAMAVPHGWNI